MNDGEEIELLRDALAPEMREPPASSVAALHAAVARNLRPSPPRRWWKSRVAAASAAFGLVLTGSTTAFALSGTPVPRPLRVVMQAAGLPVAPVAVTDTESTEDHLEGALQHADTEAVGKDARGLAARLARLTPGERAKVEPEASRLLHQADTFDDRGPDLPPAVKPSGGGGAINGVNRDERRGPSRPDESPLTTASPGRDDHRGGGSDAPAPTSPNAGTSPSTAKTTGGSNGGGAGGGDDMDHRNASTTTSNPPDAASPSTALPGPHSGPGGSGANSGRDRSVPTTTQAHDTTVPPSGEGGSR